MTTNSITLSVPGMSCDHCEFAVKSEVSKVAGVESVTVDLDSKDVEVTGMELDSDAVVAAVREAGYAASVHPR